MPALARGDAERLLRFVAEAEIFGGDHPFEGEFLTQLGRLVPADWVGYTHCTGFHFDRPGDEEFFSEIDWPAVGPVVNAENPVFLRLFEGGVEAVKLSDFLTPRELKRTRMYGLVLKPCGLVDSLGVRLQIGPPRLNRLFVFDRTDRNFGDRDRAILDALRPHLERLHQAARVRRRLRDALALHESSRAAIVLLENEDRVAFASTAALELIDRYFGEKRPRLPDALASWLRQRRRGTIGETLRIDAPDRSLIVHFVDGALLLEERQPMPRLTPREQEILDLVAEGKTNTEIAQRLWVSRGTVRKHVENIYGKLGVHTRTAAAAFVRDRRPVGP